MQLNFQLSQEQRFEFVFIVIFMLLFRKMIKKKHFRVKHQKVKLFRANEPILSVFMWGINHTVSQSIFATISYFYPRTGQCRLWFTGSFPFIHKKFCYWQIHRFVSVILCILHRCISWRFISAEWNMFAIIYLLLLHYLSVVAHLNCIFLRWLVTSSFLPRSWLTQKFSFSFIKLLCLGWVNEWLLFHYTLSSIRERTLLSI